VCVRVCGGGGVGYLDALRHGVKLHAPTPQSVELQLCIHLPHLRGSCLQKEGRTKVPLVRNAQQGIIMGHVEG
jgi:hypothetical protein